MQQRPLARARVPLARPVAGPRQPEPVLPQVLGRAQGLRARQKPGPGPKSPPQRFARRVLQNQAGDPDPPRWHFGQA